MKKVVLVLILSSIVALGMFLNANAQSFGKVAGYVTDAESHQPIGKVNIELTDDSLQVSSSTDADGIYVLLRVPEGKPNVTFSCAGYKTLAMVNVWVLSGLTTRLDVELSPCGSGETEQDTVKQEYKPPIKYIGH
jgi:hypothetical protein